MVAHSELDEVTYAFDGTTMVGRLAVPAGEGRGPAVLIAHEANGLDDQQADRARRLAELGYVALAVDYHGDGRVLTDRAAVDARLAELAADAERATGLVAAGLDVLTGHPRVDPARVAAIGYCQGGALVLALARTGADLRAVVGFHPGLTARDPAGSARITGAVLVCVGSEDPYVPAADQSAFAREMASAGVDWQLHVYGGAAHSFTHPHAGRAGRQGLAYHRASADRAWRAMLDLFAEVL